MTKSNGDSALAATNAAITERDAEHPQTGLGDAVAAQPGKPVAKIVVEEDVWRRDNPDLVCPMQRATAVYQNTFGQAVILQERAWDEEDDICVIISKHCLQDVIDRLQNILRSAD